MKVISDRMVFVGGSRVPAGTPFDVVDDAKLEPGMTEVGKPKAKAKAEPKAEPKDEPKTLADITAADAKAAEPKGAEGQARV
jgi:hypothetical protein